MANNLTLYAKAVQWIAHNDNPDQDDPDTIAELKSVQLLANMFGDVFDIDVANDVVKVREDGDGTLHDFLLGTGDVDDVSYGLWVGLDSDDVNNLYVVAYNEHGNEITRQNLARKSVIEQVLLRCLHKAPWHITKRVLDQLNTPDTTP